MATVLVLIAALIGAGVRLLPWVLDPTLTNGTLAPFAKSLLAVAVEAAILTGWPVGWAFAVQRLVERGEARVLASLGESPLRTMARLVPQAMLFVLLLAMTSLVLGRDARAPGRVVDALVQQGRSDCASTSGNQKVARAVPFVSATWLCSTDSPRLVGRAPLGHVVFNAANAHVSDDLRRIDLDDARLLLGAPEGAAVRVHVGSLSLSGMAPWTRASSVPPFVRALVVTTSGLGTSCAVVLALLRLRRRRIGSVVAVGFGAIGPLAALGVLRALELRVPDVTPGPWLSVLVLVPVAAVSAVLATVALVASLRRKRQRRA